MVYDHVLFLSIPEKCLRVFASLREGASQQHSETILATRFEKCKLQRAPLCDAQNSLHHTHPHAADHSGGRAARQPAVHSGKIITSPPEVVRVIS